MTPSRLETVDAVAARIRRGESLLLSGDPQLLAKLPNGNWLAGSIPYFHDAQGMRESREVIGVDTLPREATGMRIEVLSATEVASVAQRAQPGEYVYVIAPAFSEAVNAFVAQEHEIPGLLNQPVVGWVSGVALSEIGATKPVVVDGRTGTIHDNALVCAYIALPRFVRPVAKIVNVFTPGDGPTIEVENDGTTHTYVIADGKRRLFADILKETHHDVRFPLVTNSVGARFNVSFQSVEESTGEVKMFLPLIPGIEYRLAKPLTDYRQALVDTIAREQPADPAHTSFCVLHYAHGSLANHHIGNFHAALAFGEIAYIMHNQTVVFLSIEKA
jgi:hypothetical protein